MLEPRDRLLLFEALRPPEEFRFDQGIGTTYSLDLLALLTTPLAFTWFEQQGDEGQPSCVDSLEILESLRRHADKLTIFCHAGRIAIPKTFYPQLAFVEGSIIECQPKEGAAFHPKVWVIRFVSSSGGVRYRVLCLSRNLTFSRAWDTLLSLDGSLSPNRQSPISRNRGLVDFVRALPHIAIRRSIEPSISLRVETLASELERTEFELPDGMTDIHFWPLGIGGRLRDPLADAGSRLLVVSPFITLGKVEELAEGRKEVIVVSTAESLAHLARRPDGVGKFYCLNDRAIIESDTESEESDKSENEAFMQADLHAKLYVSESGWDAHVWTGSANATDAAFKRNVEFLIELIGPKKKFGIDAMMEAQKGEIRFINILEDAERFIASEQNDSTIETLEQKMESLRNYIASASLEANVTPGLDGSFNVGLVCGADLQVIIDSDVTSRCWPVTVSSSIGESFNELRQNEIVANFEGLSFQAITSFFAFELTGHLKAEERQLRFVVNASLKGAPEGRRENVLRSLVKDRSRMMRFLWLLLADEGIAIPELLTTNNKESNGYQRSPGLSASGLFEQLLRNLDRAPERLDSLNSLLLELRQGSDGQDLLPEGFDAIWEPVWRQRERMRSRIEA